MYYFIPYVNLFDAIKFIIIIIIINISQICFCSQISLQSAAVNCSFGIIFILLAMVNGTAYIKQLDIMMKDEAGFGISFNWL